jgi:hypothetical protein
MTLLLWTILNQVILLFADEINLWFLASSLVVTMDTTIVADNISKFPILINLYSSATTPFDNPRFLANIHRPLIPNCFFGVEISLATLRFWLLLLPLICPWSLLALIEIPLVQRLPSLLCTSGRPILHPLLQEQIKTKTQVEERIIRN